MRNKKCVDVIIVNVKRTAAALVAAEINNHGG
jgi:hypothetical protein